MLMVTRTDSIVELGRDGRRQVAFDTARLASASLSVERAPCGRIVQALLLQFRDGAQPLRIEGQAAELGALHQTVAEVMLEAGTIRAVH